MSSARISSRYLRESCLRLLGMLLVLAPGGGAGAAEAGPFAYDASQPLDAEVVLLDRFPGAVVYDVSYASPKGGRVTALLVTPEAPGRYAGMLFGHWGGGDRAEFLPEAILLARAGAVSLLPAYPWTRPAPWRQELRYSSDPEHDRDLYIQTVVDLRRGLDLLVSRPDVDPARIGYVGHSYGAQWGAILSAVDRRPQAVVLVGGVPDLEAIYVESNDPDVAALRASDPARVEKLLAVMGPFAAARHVGQAAPVPLLFQFALYEQNFPRSAMERYFAAASAPKEIRWYATAHDLNDPQALVDRAAWLRPRLGLGELVLPTDAPPMESPAAGDGRVRSADGVEIAHSARGEGETALVFVHGGLADRAFWAPQMQQLADRYRVVALDLAGHGASGRERAAWTIPAFSQDVRAVVEALDLRRAVLVGNSLGGPVALEAAALLPGRVIGVVAVDTLHDATITFSPGEAKARAAAFRQDFPAACHAMVVSLFHAETQPELRDWAERRMCGMPRQVVAGMMEGFAGYDVGAACRRAGVPIRAINGDLWPTNVERGRTVAPGFAAAVMAGTGHFPMLERPAEFNRHLVEFAEGFAAAAPR